MQARPSPPKIRRRLIAFASFRTPRVWIVRWYHRFSLGLLILFLRRRSDVCGIVLAGGSARRTPRGGLSDIEFYVVIDSGPQAERVRDDIMVDLDFLRRFLSPLAGAGETEVLTCADLDTLRVTRPHLFVQEGHLKPVFSRADFEYDAFVGPGDQAIPSDTAVRVAALSDVWRKFLIHLTRASLGEASARNALDRVIDLLGDDLPPDQMESPEPAFVLKRLVEAIMSAAGVDGRETRLMANRRSVIPNRLFRETRPVALLRDYRRIPERLIVVRRDSEDSKERHLDLETLRAMAAESDAHYLCFGGVLLPLVAEAFYGILTAESNPSTFAAISESEAEADPIRPIAAINAADAAALSRDTEFIFPNGVSGLVFALREILHWLGRDESRGIDVIGALIADGVEDEACFAAQALLKETTRSNLRVSVLVPTFNRSALLEQTMNTLLAQSRTPDEILVVDNGSTDSTPALLDRISAEHPQVRWVVEEERGFVAVRNRLVREADPRSDIVLFVDDDCLTPPEWVRGLMLPFEYDPDIVSCGGGVTFRDDDCTPWGDFYRQKYKIAPLEPSS